MHHMKLLFSLLTLALPFGNGFVAPALSQREHVKSHVRGTTNHQPVQVRQHRSPMAGMKWSSLSTDAGDAGDGPLKNVARAYTLVGMASAVAWIAIAYIGLSFHPTSSVNADCGFRHNFLTIAQAFAFPLPVGWAAFHSLHSAASVGWDRLSSATYRRLNLGVAVASLYMAAATGFAPQFATGYDLFPIGLRISAAVIHSVTALLSLSVWRRTVTPSASVGPLIRGVVGSLWTLGPRNPSADPDDPSNTSGASLYAMGAAGLLWFSIFPIVSTFPLATIPAILGKRLSRTVSGFTFLGAVTAYCLKDAAECGRLDAPTFVTLRRGMAIGAGGHLLLLAMKLMGVDGGGLVWPGGGLWRYYPSMAAVPFTAASSAVIYFLLWVAACTPPSKRKEEV
jgi:hypothetical protein